MTGIRDVWLIGEFDAQERARQEIASILARKGAGDVLQAGNVIETIEVPERFVGLFIGKGGEHVNAVRDETGVSAVLDNNPAEGAEWRHLVLRGLPENVAKAREQYQFRILELYRNAGIFNAVLEKKFGNREGAINDIARLPLTEKANMNVDSAQGLCLPLESFQFQQPTCVKDFQCNDESRLGTGATSCATATLPLPLGPSATFGAISTNQPTDEYLIQMKQWASYYAKDPRCVVLFRKLKHQAARGMHNKPTFVQ